jgi:hypothetical protein
MTPVIFPVQARRIVLRCLRDTDIGAFPEFRLGALLLSVDAQHKNHGDSIALEVPRTAKVRYARHERFEFQLYAAASHADRLKQIEALLRDLPDSSPLCGPDIAFGDNWALHGIEDLYSQGPLEATALDDEVAQWRGTMRFRLQLTSPLRIALTEAQGLGRKRRYLNAAADIDDRALQRALTQSLVHLKFLFGDDNWRVPEFPLRIVEQQLWCVGSPVSQGGKHPNAFEEGLLGDWLVEWAMPPEDTHWQHLLLLTRFGAGQGRAFGLGRIRLAPEQHPAQNADATFCDHQDLCDRLLPNWREFERLQRHAVSGAVVELHAKGWRPVLSLDLREEHLETASSATIESRIAGLTGRMPQSGVPATLTKDHNDTACRALRLSALARVCMQDQLRMLWSQDGVLILSRKQKLSAALRARIIHAVQREGIALQIHAAHDTDAATGFTCGGFCFIGGLMLPGNKTSMLIAVDEPASSEETQHMVV